MIENDGLPGAINPGRKEHFMRLNYYRFPDDAPVDAMVAEGCEGIREDGRLVNWWQAEEIIDWSGIMVEDKTLGGIKVSAAKNLLRQLAAPRGRSTSTATVAASRSLRSK